MGQYPIIHYAPAIRCAKCGKAPEFWSRSHDSRTGKRTIRVRCHGATTEIPFVTEPGQTVEVFAADDSKSGDDKEEPEPVLVLTDNPQPTATLQGLGQFDRTLAHAVDDINRNRAMKEVIGLPDGLNGLIAAMNLRAKAAMERLSASNIEHEKSVHRVHAVAEVLETATQKTNHFVDEMMGGGNGAKVDPTASADSSQKSAA